MPKVQQRKSGRYFVRLRVDDRQTTVSFDTEYEAARFAADVDEYGGDEAFNRHIMDEEAREALENEMTLSDWAPRFFRSLTRVGPDTLTNYKRDWEKRWKPHLGHLRLSQITREHVAAALNAQTGADKTIANAWGCLASMFKMAVLDGHIDRSPAAGIRLARRTDHERGEHRYLTAAEMLQVIEDTPERYKPLVWMLVGTGMRWGEATALTVADVNLTARTVRITKAWKRDQANGRWFVGPTKTGKSKRTVTLPNEVVDAVRPLTVGRGRKELLFTNRNGEHVKHQPFYREHWTKACTSNLEEPRPRIHDLRHSHVAVMIAGGVSLPVIQARLGHEKITTTIDTYGHLLPDLQVAAADAVSAALGAAVSPRALLG